MRLVPAVAVLLLAAPAARAAPADASDAAAITAVIQDSAKAWSAGDLDGFMRSYEEGPDTVFLTAQGPVKGYAAIAARYRARYGAARQGMGALTFDGLQVEGLGRGYAVAYGRFHLRRAGSPKEETGVFDLIFHKGANGWRIVSDHTS